MRYFTVKVNSTYEKEIMKNVNRDKHRVTRRDFLTTSLAMAGSLSLFSPTAGGVTLSGADAKPNILMIMTDQQTASAMSCAGNAYLRTPALDGLAARRVRFDNAYVTQPLCMPCRSSLQTGRYPHEIGVLCNGMDIKGEFPMLGNLARDLLQSSPGTAYRRFSNVVDSVVVHEALRLARGNQLHAAALMGISRTTLRAKLRSLGLSVEKQLSVDNNLD